MAYATAVTIKDMYSEFLFHPPYSPDLSPSNCHIFGPLKEAIGEKTFHYDEVQGAVYEWLCTQ
jgi:hypothetical protein